MNPQTRSAPPLGSLTSLTPLQRDALILLREAAITADSLGQSIWQFSVEIERFHAAGLSNTEIRQLLCLGYVEHGQERTPEGAHERIFQRLNALALPNRTCFVVTAKGWETASEQDTEETRSVPLSVISLSDVGGYLPQVPRWDGESRQLWWQGLLIKVLRRAAPNQETILTAFEEEGWPSHLDDPLPQTPGIDPKVRLHDTIKHLNRHHLRPAICFRGDGRGSGIRWVVEESL